MRKSVNVVTPINGPRQPWSLGLSCGMAGSEVIMTFQRQALNLAAGGPQCALHSLSLNHEMRN